MNNILEIQDLIGMSSFFVLVVLFLFKKIKPVTLALLYFSIHAVIFILLPQKMFSGFQVEEIVAFESSVSKSFLMLISAVGICLLIEEKKLKYILMGFAVVNAIIILLSPSRWFLFNNPAADASFIACMLPFFLGQKLGRKILLPIALVAACFITKSSSGVLGVGVAVACWYVADREFKKSHLWVAASVLIAVAFLGYVFQGDVLFDSSGRYYIWKIMMSFWWRTQNSLFGAGLGTYALHSRGLQVAMAVKQCNDLGAVDLVNKCMSEVSITNFPTLHNDWLQILFETGVVGLEMVVSVFVVAVYKARKNPAIFSSLITFGCMACLQMPLRMFFYSVLGAFLLAQAFLSEKKERPHSALLRL